MDFQDSQKILTDLYSDIREWLKFAEAKNAALLTFDSACLFTLLRYQDVVFPKKDGYANLFFTISLIIILISIIILMISFLPKRFKKGLKNNEHSHPFSKNLLYYGDIVKYSPQRFLASIFHKYNIDNFDKNNKYFNDLCTQIISLSRISVRKYRMFKCSLVLNILFFIIIGIYSLMFF
ncbi:hypothetical protein ETC01_00705 [Geobacillus sp. NFOSA3]|uniref:Pycsar system effector family protein n=1 Tax=Parageobacillus toebii TaxID=153151 RepID=UPI001492D0AA|nr:Pycsar system effector family protein [Parageobacillus toebii]MED4990111.1 DUF5706 domain-containing protein [Parageobacillus toebii]NNU91852.1 hypothetical protein [Geobacillus sp. NFOSA3]